jgi:ankyrin repeat protein
MASRLISRGANINYVNTNGKTPLHILIENKQVTQIKYLLTKGADPHIMDLTGMDVCDKVFQFGL